MKSEISSLKGQYADSYIVYTRKSTDDAQNQRNSIEYQTQEIMRYATREGLLMTPQFDMPGFCETGIIREHHSGFKQSGGFYINEDGSVSQKVERPKFLVMIDMLQRREFKGVISLCWDRISRNDADDVIIKKLIKSGVDVRFVQVEYDKSSSGDLHMDIDGVFSRHFSRVISEKVKLAGKKLRAEGRCLHLSPIGYLDHGSDSKPFDKVRAPIVKQLFERYAQGGWSYGSLARWANDQGLKTKPQRRHRTRQELLAGVQLEDLPKIEKPVSKKTVEKILTNPFYTGINVFRGEWIKSTSHQPLIDRDLFYRVKAMTRDNNRSIRYPETSFYAYRRLVTCAGCGRVYTPYTKKGHIYYFCRCRPDCGRETRNIAEAHITQQIAELLERIPLTQKEISHINHIADSELNKLNKARELVIEPLIEQMKKAIADLEYLHAERITLLRTNAMSAEQISAEENRLEGVVDRFKEAVNDQMEHSRATVDYIVNFSGLIKNAAVYYRYALDTEKREIASALFSELSLDGITLKYTLKDGFNALFMRFDANIVNSGAPPFPFSELGRIHALCKLSGKTLERFGTGKEKPT